MPESPDIPAEVRSRLRRDDRFTQNDVEECEDLLERHYEELPFPEDIVRLDSLELENFKILDEEKIDFQGDSSLLHGLNSAGKTSFLTAIQFNLLGIPDTSADRTQYSMTELIQDDAEMVRTEGTWAVGETKYLLQRFLERRGRGGAYTRYNEPRITELTDGSGLQYDQRDTQSDVSKVMGFQSLERRGFNSFGIASLFFLMSKDFRLFLDWHRQSDMIDLLFGLSLTRVISGIDSKIEEEYKITSEDEKVPQMLAQYESEKQELKESLSDLRSDEENAQTHLSDRRDQLESVEQVLEGENRLNKLESRKGELQNRLFDLKQDRQEIQNQARQTQVSINRYQDADLKGDLSSIADELRDLMTVPDRCPVCTNEVDQEQRERLVERHQCPLCSKEMPEDRIRVERENQVPNSVTSVQHERRGEIEELENRLEELVDEEGLMTERIENLQAELDAVESHIEQSDLTEYAEQREELQREVQMLRKRAVDLEVEVEGRERRLRDVEESIENLQTKHKELKAKRNKVESLTRFKRIVREVRDNQRREVKNQLETEMDELLTYFTDGLFGSATKVEFTNGSNYRFTIYTDEGRRFKSHITDQNTAEVVLHALLFHTSLLKRLAKMENTLPFRLFVIDAPFANEMDIGNANDITKFLSQLPNILENYQVIVSAAETESFDTNAYTQYDIKELDTQM